MSSEPGSVTLHISHATPTISTASDEQWREQINGAAWYDVKWEESVEVPAITLDMLIEEYGMPDFCKVDVENYEAQVLEGLSVAIPCLSFEYYPPHMKDTLRCFDILSKLGTYEFNWSFGESKN